MINTRGAAPASVESVETLSEFSAVKTRNCCLLLCARVAELYSPVEDRMSIPIIFRSFYPLCHFSRATWYTPSRPNT